MLHEGEEQPFLPVTIVLSDEREEYMDFLVDTGWEGFMILSDANFNRIGFSGMIDATIPIEYKGPVGEIYPAVALRITVKLQKPKIQLDGIVSSTKGMKDDLVGLEFLQKFKICLDGSKREFKIGLA